MKKNAFAALALALCLFAGCASAAPEPQQTVPAASEQPQAAPAAQSAPAAETPPDTSKVADASQTTAREEVGVEGMTPLDASGLKDGTYPVAVDCSSSMFRVVSCELTVSDGAMSARMTMSSDSYGYLYPGTAEAAAAAKKADYLTPTVENGVGTFTFPVPALDRETDCAAWSRSKELWYDRTLVFRSDSLPREAFADGALVTAQSLGLADGRYTAEVALGGGSGRASVQSPCALLVENGAATAELVWSSANYDYMKVDGVRYDAEIVDGASTFKTIPVAVFDRPLAVIADTTAMSQPHEIEYTLLFDSATIAPAS